VNHRERRQHRFEREHGLDPFASGERVDGLAETNAVAGQVAECSRGSPSAPERSKSHAPVAPFVCDANFVAASNILLSRARASKSAKRRL
jgi:hypothetical protein